MTERRDIVYTASPTLARFHASRAVVRGIRGPIGSGKSVGCVNDVMAKALEQRPGKDGIRRSRWGVVRNTYAELKSTTIKTWLDWYGAITHMVYDAPIIGKVRFGDVELELVFVSLDKPKDIKKLLSLELTGAWLNEARELPRAVLDGALGRTGRYPSKRDGGASWSGVIMDTNPPDDTHWWYALAEEERPLGYEFWSQPGALLKRPDGTYVPNPAAENVEHHELGFDYWMRQVPGKRAEWIKVYLLGQYGTVLDGRPVFPEYNDEVHCAEDIIEPLRGIPLLLGWDWGRTPACVIGQLSPKGQLRVLDELVVDATGEGMGVRKFAREVVKPHLAIHYPGMAIALSLGDPSGVARDGSDQSCFDIVGQEGIPTEPAPSNDPVDRQDAVIKMLTANVDGAPAYQLSPKCSYIRRGFLGGYRYARLNVSGDERYREAPEKNRFSHPHDAHQHLCQAARGTNKVEPKARARAVTPRTAAGWT